MGSCIGNDVSPDAADDTRNAIQCPIVDVTDVRKVLARKQGTRLGRKQKRRYFGARAMERLVVRLYDKTLL